MEPCLEMKGVHAHPLARGGSEGGFASATIWIQEHVGCLSACWILSSVYNSINFEHVAERVKWGILNCLDGVLKRQNISGLVGEACTLNCF